MSFPRFARWKLKLSEWLPIYFTETMTPVERRNFALSRRGVVDPVVVVPMTAHAAFDKACSMLGIRLCHVPVDKFTGRVDLQAMRRFIDKNTCLLAGSAPNFPFGTFDDISSIAKLGIEYNIPVHVDACLGGFLVAFAEHSPALAHLPPFDFTVPGVTSISCDTHKYGYAPKGTSVVLYRRSELLHHQYFCSTEWPGGLYATPTLSGSRAGLNIALTWATLQHFGAKEYARRANLILLRTAQLADSVGKIPGICLVGTPEVSVVAFSSNRFNIHAVGDCLGKLGWNLNFLQKPNALHFCITYNQTADGVLNAFLEDLKIACEEVAASPDRGESSKTAAIYGMAAKIPDKGIIEEVAHLYIDACYSMPTHT
uniref:sphinganine-1-phosphate aldolase n=1 Tax=Globodera rostochiensis TaxID=31243 RepID=A0A914GVD7_GLORO